MVALLKCFKSLYLRFAEASFFLWVNLVLLIFSKDDNSLEQEINLKSKTNEKSVHYLLMT